MKRMSNCPTEMPPFDLAAYARSMTGADAVSDVPPCLAPIHGTIPAPRSRALAALLEALLNPPPRT